MTDVVVIGAGVVGCASAIALARRGASVRIVERAGVETSGEGTGDGASWAAAGILGAQVEAAEDNPLVRLCLEGRARYAVWAPEIAASTGLDVGYRRAGALHVALDAEEREEIVGHTAWQVTSGLTLEPVDGRQARAIEPEISPAVLGGVRFPDDARIDPPSWMRALRLSAGQAGVQFHSGSPVRKILVSEGRASGVLLEDGASLRGGKLVLAAGCWTSQIEGTGLPVGAVRPARGQIVELSTGRRLLDHVIYGPGCYLSPREDGRVLIGATTEFVGYEPGVTAGAVRDLISAAVRLVPVLASASVTRLWSGFRPYTQDTLPVLGEGAVRGLILATGHFRNGVLLGPISGEIVAALAAGERPPVDVAPFAPDRLRVEGGAQRAEGGAQRAKEGA
ncbi:glycine oxidase ThiO [Chondromyces crocatus]|uniref:Glycine oxidase n=1 Tax=Chondromyces crocatus TaxID=52 RepID=A0A0K1E6K9_CHOCO|nr:glycine oxidase ThiO [Chondromyces crocatus]AKT36193.1 glycine oxidase [Chondromyces crocatus]